MRITVPSSATPIVPRHRREINTDTTLYISLVIIHTNIQDGVKMTSTSTPNRAVVVAVESSEGATELVQRLVGL